MEARTESACNGRTMSIRTADLQSGLLLRVIGQDSRMQNSQSYGDAIDVSKYRVRWRFVGSYADLSSDENILDVARLLDSALLLQRRSGEATITMGRSTLLDPQCTACS